MSWQETIARVAEFGSTFYPHLEFARNGVRLRWSVRSGGCTLGKDLGHDGRPRERQSMEEREYSIGKQRDCCCGVAVSILRATCMPGLKGSVSGAEKRNTYW